MKQRMKRFAAATLLLGAIGCDGPGVTSPTTAIIGRTGTTNPSTALVGSWRRIVFFFDDFNFASSSETTFQFAGDGTVVRSQIARNHTLGLVDVLVSTGRWRLQGTQLALDFVTPSSFQIVFEVRVVGDQLELAGQTYLRVTG